MEICTEEKKRNAVVLVVLKVQVDVFRHEDDRFLHGSGCVWTVYKTSWSIESSTSASNSSFAMKNLTLLQWSPQFKQRNEQNKPTFVQSYFPLQFVLHCNLFFSPQKTLFCIRFGSFYGCDDIVGFILAPCNQMFLPL